MRTHAATGETLERVLAAFNRHDLDALMARFAEDAGSSNRAASLLRSPVTNSRQRSS